MVEELLVPVGERVPIGTPLALLRAVGAPAVAPTPAAASVPAVPAPAPRGAPAPVVVTAAAHRPRVSPLARRIAADLHVDLSTLTGSGPGGAVVRADVERAAAGLAERERTAEPAGNGSAPAVPPTPPALPEPPEPPAPGMALRIAMGNLMVRSKREVPHYYLRSEIELSDALARLRADNAARPVAERVPPRRPAAARGRARRA